MKKIKIIIIVFLILSLYTKPTKAQDYVWMVGPMFHANFGLNGIHFSWALEASYWDFTSFPFGIDGGIEFEKNKVRLYSEAQTGIGLAGISGGPVLQISKIGEGNSLGFQGSIWANYFIGTDIRLRAIDDTKYFCPGTYLKIPVKFDSSDSNNSNSSNTDWDDLFD